MKESGSADIKSGAVNPNQLRRKILRIAKELFLSPIKEGVASKSRAPSKKEILSKLTKEEARYLNENIDSVFPVGMPERIVWNIYSERNLKKREEVLLRLVAEDRAIIAERELIEGQFKEDEDRHELNGKYLPSRQEVLIKLPEDERAVLEQYNGQAPVLYTTVALATLKPKDRLYYFATGTLQHEKIANPTDIHSEYVAQNKKQFMMSMSFIHDVLRELKKYREVKDSTKMSGRIKSSDSAKKNDSIKALDDIFGMEIDFTTSSERENVQQIVASMLDIKKEKIHNKSNGYIAYHCNGAPFELDKNFEETRLYHKLQELYLERIYIKRLISNVKRRWNSYRREVINQLLSEKKYFDQNRCIRKEDKLSKERTNIIKRFLTPDPSLTKEEVKIAQEEIRLLTSSFMPSVELQFKTLAVANEAIHGAAAHHLYKDEEMLKEEKLTSNEMDKVLRAYMDKIQNKYTTIWKANGGDIPDSLVPIMWISGLDEVTGENCEIDGFSRLSNMEALKHMYPFFIDPSDLGIKPLEYNIDL